MEELARCGSNQASEKNIRRNLHKFVHRTGRTLPISIDYVRCTVRRIRGKIETIPLPWPIIHLSTWIHFIMSTGGRLLLGGFHIMQEHMWKKMFDGFWRDYRKVDPTHPLYHQEGVKDYSTYIPFTLHGDEGRGKNKAGVMVESFCPLITVKGPGRTNLKGSPVLNVDNSDFVRLGSLGFFMTTHQPCKAHLHVETLLHRHRQCGLRGSKPGRAARGACLGLPALVCRRCGGTSDCIWYAMHVKICTHITYM